AALDENVLFLDVAVNKAFLMGKIQCRKDLFDYPDNLRIFESPSVSLCEARGVHSGDKLRYEIDHTVMPAVFDEAHDIGMLQGRRYFDLAQKAFQRLLANGDLGQERLDRHDLAVDLRTCERHAAHTSLTDDPDHLIIGQRLWIFLQLLAANIADVR